MPKRKNTMHDEEKQPDMPKDVNMDDMTGEKGGLSEGDVDDITIIDEEITFIPDEDETPRDADLDDLDDIDEETVDEDKP